MTALDQWEIFIASKPEEQREFRTLEFFHPDFASIQRFVQDFVSAQLTLESTAPRNASTTVTFNPLSMVITEPTENQDGVQLLTVSLGATNDELQNQIDLITPANAFKPVECIYRKFYSGNTSEPVLVLNLSISTVDFEGYTKNNITAEDSDLANKSSGEFYTLSRFPTLSDI